MVFLDISATEQKRKTLAALVLKVVEAIDIPFTVGGISSVEDVAILLNNGADKVSINSACSKTSRTRNNELVTQFGSRCVVVAIDAKQVNGEWLVHLVVKVPTQINLFDQRRS